MAPAGEKGNAELHRAHTHVNDDVDDALELPTDSARVPPSLPGYLLEFVRGVERRLLTEVLLCLPTPRLRDLARSKQISTLTAN